MCGPPLYVAPLHVPRCLVPTSFGCSMCTSLPKLTKIGSLKHEDPFVVAKMASAPSISFSRLQAPAHTSQRIYLIRLRMRSLSVKETHMAGLQIHHSIFFTNAAYDKCKNSYKCGTITGTGVSEALPLEDDSTFSVCALAFSLTTKNVLFMLQSP